MSPGVNAVGAEFFSRKKSITLSHEKGDDVDANLCFALRLKHSVVQNSVANFLHDLHRDIKYFA